VSGEVLDVAGVEALAPSDVEEDPVLVDAGVALEDFPLSE